MTNRASRGTGEPARNRWDLGGTTITFNSRTTTSAWLSNFWEHELWIPTSLGPACFTSVEAAYQFAKHRPEEITLERLRHWSVLRPHEAKRQGKTIILRPDWEMRKERVMELLLDHKFALGERLTDALLATQHAPLVHLSPWDRFWGVDQAGAGQNRLGVLLMERRVALLATLKRTN